MQVKFHFYEKAGEGSITITREPGDRKFYGMRFAHGEHNFLHNLCKWLNARGFNLIKVRAQKDGHMVGDEYQPYLRPPKRGRKRTAPDIYIISGFYALRGANEDFNQGEVMLNVHSDVLDRQPNCKQLVADLGHQHGFEVTGDLSPVPFEEGSCV